VDIGGGQRDLGPEVLAAARARAVPKKQHLAGCRLGIRRRDGVVYLEERIAARMAKHVDGTGRHRADAERARQLAAFEMIVRFEAFPGASPGEIDAARPRDRGRLSAVAQMDVDMRLADL